MAEDGVVLPIPMSPVPKRSTGASASSSFTISIPASMDKIASSLVIAGSFVKLAVPFLIFL